MLSWLTELFNKFGNMLIEVLPHSPFIKYINLIEKNEYLGYINWFIPIGAFVTMLTSWLIAIAVFYAYMILARWLKLLE